MSPGVCLAQVSAEPVSTAEAWTILDALQAKYAAAQSFRASFRQEVADRRFGKNPNPAQGDVLLQKKGKMRWRYAAPNRKEIVADGHTLWIDDPETNQTLVNDRYQADQLPVSIAFLWGEGKIRQHFRLTGQKKEAEGRWIMSLEPKEKREELSRLELEIDVADLQLRRTAISDIHGTTNTLFFTRARLGKAQPQREFAFTPPKGRTVLRLDQINFRF